MTAHSLDIVLATHNRAVSLARALASIREIRTPTDWSVHVIVVGNACTDDTPQVVETFRGTTSMSVSYVAEPTAGKSHALNAGVRHGVGEWVAFFDDDERVFSDWLEVFAREQSALAFDFVAGRYVAEYESPPPAWLPPRHTTSVIVRHPEALPRQPLDADAAWMWGGNCAIRRSVLTRVGPFETAWGRGVGMRSLGCEDSEMQLRLLQAGFRGWYVPELQVWHWVPTARMTHAHFRAKRFWAGYTMRMFELAHPEYFKPQRQLLGIPRWRWRAGAVYVLEFLRSRWQRSEGHRLDAELDCREFFGYLRARVVEAFPAIGR